MMASRLLLIQTIYFGVPAAMLKRDEEDVIHLHRNTEQGDEYYDVWESISSEYGFEEDTPYSDESLLGEE